MTKLIIANETPAIKAINKTRNILFINIIILDCFDSSMLRENTFNFSF